MLLDERIIEKLTERLVERIEQGNTYILKQIGENIKQIGGVIPSRAYQLVQILKYGGNYNNILRELARITELNIKDIEDIFEAVAKENQLFAKQFYDYKNVKYIPYNENITLQNQVKALARITMGEYLNISNTTAIGFTVKDLNGNIVFRDIGTMYKEVIDKAVLNIGQGKDTFYNQMRNVLNELGESGIKTLDYVSGRHMRLDSAVRMNMQGALRDLSNTLQRQFGEEYGADGIEVSVHNNPAPDHEKIQGHQFTFEEYEKFKSDLPFKDINGNNYPTTERHIGEWNCYHYEFNIVVGVNKPNYTEEQLQQIIDENKKGFEIDGKHYTNYEGTQLQRRMETEIRKQKDKQILAKASGDEQLIDTTQKQIKQLTLKYKELSDISGLPTKMQRLQVNGYKNSNVNLQKYFESKLIGLKTENTEISSISPHFIEQAQKRKVNINSHIDTLNNPLKYDKIRTDKSQIIIGEKSTIVINVETGKLITTYPTSSKKAKRLKGELP